MSSVCQKAQLVTLRPDVNFGMGSCSMRVAALLFLLASPAAFAQTAATPPRQPQRPRRFPEARPLRLASRCSRSPLRPPLRRAHWGIAVTALDGTPIYGLNEGEFFRPASNAKLFTTAAAMHLLGPDTRVNRQPAVAALQSKLDGTVRMATWCCAAQATRTSPVGSFPYISRAERKRHCWPPQAPRDSRIRFAISTTMAQHPLQPKV